MAGGASIASSTTARITTIMDKWQGKRLNSPNDVVVKSDGSIWFTDPAFGLMGNYEGHVAPQEVDMNVYRVDGKTLEATIVAEGVLGPNGLCFSPDEKVLYLVESRGEPTRKILAYDVSADGKKLSNKRVHIDAGPGTPDGMRCDVDGNLWCGWGMGTAELDGVRVFAARRQADRSHPSARALRQRLLRRPQAQPAVHGREPGAVCALREHPGRGGRVMIRGICRTRRGKRRFIRTREIWDPSALSVVTSAPGGGRR